MSDPTFDQQRDYYVANTDNVKALLNEEELPILKRYFTLPDGKLRRFEPKPHQVREELVAAEEWDTNRTGKPSFANVYYSAIGKLIAVMGPQVLPAEREILSRHERRTDPRPYWARD